MKNVSWNAGGDEAAEVKVITGELFARVTQTDRTGRKMEEGEWEEKWEGPRRRSAESWSWSSAIRLADNCAGM